MTGETQETMFATMAGTFYVAAPYEEFAPAVKAFAEQGQWMKIPLVGGEETLVQAAAIFQVKRVQQVAKRQFGFC